MLKDTSPPVDPGDAKESGAIKDAPLPKHTGKGMRAVQGLVDDKPNADPPSALPQTGHLVPATVIEQIDRTRDVRKAEAIAVEEFSGKPVTQVSHKGVQGLAFEGMTQRSLEDARGAEHVVVHPKGLKLSDGRSIKPDFAVKDDKGSVVELVDAKGYTRKDVTNPGAAASSLTHMQSLKHAARYTDASAPNLDSVTFTMPRETADQTAVQDAVANLGAPERSVGVAAVGSEAEMKQRMAELKMDPAERGKVPVGLVAEMDQIAQLPVEQRQTAMAQLAGSLRGKRGDETIAGAYLRNHAEIEHNGEGISILDDSGKKHTIWYKTQPATGSSQ